MKNKFFSSIFKTSFLIGISRISGFIRELVFSAFIGTSYIMDAFIIAYTIPNFLRRILGEKSAESVFIPMYIREKEKSKEQSDEYVSKIFTFIGIILILFVLLFYPIAPFFIKLIAPGFDTQTFNTALKITFLILPYMFFIGIYAFLGALLEANKKFSLYNFSPFIFNLTLIIIVVLFYNRFTIYALSIGIMLGVIFQTLILFIQIKTLNINFRFQLDIKDPRVIKSWKLLLPIIGGSGIEKISIYVDRIMASLLPIGSISALYFSFRLIDLPFAVFSIAIGKVIHPYISSREIYNNKKLFNKFILRGIFLNLILLIPISIFSIIFAKFLVRIVFMRGAFDMNSVNITYKPLMYYAIGLFPMGLVNLFSRGFYALLDTKTPLKIAFFSAIINVIANIILMPKMGVSGLALGTSISLYFNAMYLFILLKIKIRSINEN